MRETNLVLVSAIGDVHGDVLAERAASRGLTVWRTSAREFSAESVTWRPELNEVTVGDTRVLPGIPAIFRRPGVPDVCVTDRDEQAAVAEEISVCFEGALLDLDLHWIDAPGVIKRVENKIYQYGQLVRAGIPVPESVVTSSVDLARTFAAHRRVVVKAIAGGVIDTDGEVKVLFTTEFDATNSELIAAVAFCPVFMQRLVEAQIDYRVVTVGTKSFSFERKRGPGEAIDWREADPNGSGFVISTDSQVSAMAIEGARALGLRFSSQDWIRDMDGRLWMLDANPAGQWLFLRESEPITEALLDIVAPR